MHMGRRCPAQQRRVHVYLLLQEPAKFQPSLIQMPTPACASSLGARSDLKQEAVSAVQHLYSWPQPRGTAPHSHSPCSRSGSSTCSGRDPFTVGGDASEPVLPCRWVSAGNAGTHAEAAASTDSHKCIA